MIVQNGEKKFGLLALKCKDDCIITTQDGRVAPEAKIKQQKGMLGLDETDVTYRTNRNMEIYDFES